MKKNTLIKKAIRLKRGKNIPQNDLINHFINCVINSKQENPNFEDGKRAVEFVLEAYSLREE